MVLTYEVSTRTSSACNKSLLEQRKCILDIKEKPISIYCQSYTNNYLKQSNIISVNTLHLKLPNSNFLHLNCSINMIKQSSNVSPSTIWVQLFLRLFLMFFIVNLIITLGCSSFIAMILK